MVQSEIEWTDATWNPIVGCSATSPGCTNCYAQRLAGRLEAMGMAKYAGTTRRSGRRAVWTGSVRLDPGSLDAPRSWRGPRMVFVNSMSDLFHPELPDQDVAAIWRVMADTPHHTYQILTKRAHRLRHLAPGLPLLPNVWLGVSVEDGVHAHRIDALRETPAAVRFVSFEPLIGRVATPDLTGIHWAIVGGESGPGARPIAIEWVDEILAACRHHDAAFFFKQWGGRNKKKSGRIFRGRLWDELPATPHAAE